MNCVASAPFHAIDTHIVVAHFGKIALADGVWNGASDGAYWRGKREIADIEGNWVGLGAENGEGF